MKIISKFFFMCCVICVSGGAFGDEACEYDIVANDLRQNCSGIAAELQSIKNWDVANVAVTGVGTVAAGGALYAGLKKKDLDKKAEELQKKMDDIENMSPEEFWKFYKQTVYLTELQQEYNSMCSMKKDYEAKAKNLGNWRTGLMAGNTLTAVAGTAISAKNNKDSTSIKDLIQSCLDSIKRNEQKVNQIRMNCDPEQWEKLSKAITECGRMTTENMDKVYKQTKVSAISSGINIGTGLAGTVTSAVANTNKVRDDNSTAGKEKEKDLNTAANVLAGVSMVASGVSTGFTAAALKSINKNLQAAESCEEALGGWL